MPDRIYGVNNDRGRTVWGKGRIDVEKLGDKMGEVV